jgi:hypothetical protein
MRGGMTPSSLYSPFLMSSEKKAFVLRINPDTLKELERWAQEEFRSVNGQIEFLLNEALRKRKKGASKEQQAKNEE